jgi:VCBS repeat protein/FG-GAP repeat protein
MTHLVKHTDLPPGNSFTIGKQLRQIFGIFALVMGLSIAGVRNANAYYYQFNLNGTFNVIYSDGDNELSVPCPKTAPPYPNEEDVYIWQNCLKVAAFEVQLGISPLGPQSAPRERSGASIGMWGLTPRVGMQTSGSSSSSTALTPSSSKPYLPFLGNPLVVVGYLPNTTSVDSATTAYRIGLRRQADCSLNEDFISPSAATPNAGLISTFPAAEIFYHDLAGLTTTPDVFAQGCAYAILGQPSNTGLLLQPTADGGSIMAVISGSLYAVVDDPVANRITTTMLLSSNANPSLGAVAAARLTNSGNMDIVVTFTTDPANQQFSTAVLLGNGDGTFKPAVYYDVAGDVTIDDVNGDGIADIVVCGLTPGITTLIGKGDGTFTATATSATSIRGCGSAGGQVLTGNFHTGGHKDLLVGGNVLKGNGNGTFTVGSAVTADTSFNYGSGSSVMAVGDINSDGKPDVVISQPGFVALFYGKGDGTFTAGPRYVALPDYMQVSITDLDGDGNPDIVLGNSTGGIYTTGCCGNIAQPELLQILMGRGDGTFVDSLAYNRGRYGNGEFTVAGPQIATGDFNHDGKTDALVFEPSNVGGQPSTLVMLPGNNTAALGSAVTSSVALIPTMLISPDMNKDGRPDAVLAGSTLAGPALAVLTNQGNGTFAAEQDYVLPNTAVSLAAGDFNGDGRMDVAVGVSGGFGGSGPNGVYILFGQANGALGLPVKIDSSFNPSGLAAGDINGDGRADLIVADQGFFVYAGSPNQVSGALHVYLGNANSTFTAKTAPTSAATNYSVAALGDLNGDGKLDLVLGGNIAGAQATSTPSVYTFLGNGDGTFKAASATALIGNYGIGSTAIALADFNHDGKLDVAVGDATAFTSILLGNGDGTFATTMLPLGQQPGAIAAVDLNGDGFPELLVAATNDVGNGNLSVFMNSNAWSPFATMPSYGAGQLTLPEVNIGRASYSDMVITVGKIVSGPTGTEPESSGDIFNPATGQMSISQALVNGATFHNVVITVGSLVSIGSVSGADSYDGSNVLISSVQVGGTIYDNVVITLGSLVSVKGGMPSAIRDQYNPASHQLLIPAVEFNGNVYTNVTITVGSVVSIGGTG